jgi:hypothetical protein
MIGVYVGFSRIFLPGILIFKGLTARRLYKSFGVKGLIVGRLKMLRNTAKSNEANTPEVFIANNIIRLHNTPCPCFKPKLLYMCM